MAAGRGNRRGLLWFLVFAALEAADVLSSLSFRPSGEGNPVIRWAMLELGDDWIVPKLGVSLAVGAWCAWRWRLGHRIILIGSSAVLAFVVAGNVAQHFGWL